MAIIPGGVLGKGEWVGNSTPVMNPGIGGQNGHMPIFGKVGADGNLFDAWVHSQPKVTKDVIPLLLDYCRFLDLLPEKERHNSVLSVKAIMEVCANSINGLNSTMEVASEGIAVGRTAEQFQVPTKVSIAQSQISYEYTEVLGRSLGWILEFWIRYGIQDPLTGVAGIRPFVGKDYKDNQLYTADLYSCICTYIEPDPLVLRAENCWISVNLYPSTAGEITGKRELQGGGALIPISVQYGGITIRSGRTAALGTYLLNKLETLNLTPDEHLILPRIDIDPVIADTPSGFDSYKNFAANEELYKDIGGGGIKK